MSRSKGMSPQSTVHTGPNGRMQGRSVYRSSMEHGPSTAAPRMIGIQETRVKISSLECVG